MIEAYNNGCVHFNEEGEQAQLRGKNVYYSF